MANPIVLYDGHCNLCNHSVSFIRKRDKRYRFVFVSSLSEQGMSLMKEFGIQHIGYESIVLIEDGVAFQKSTAVLRICRNLPLFWPVLSVFLIIPRPIRDWFYNIVARNRYK